jgi:hypothetical protein
MPQFRTVCKIHRVRKFAFRRRLDDFTAWPRARHTLELPPDSSAKSSSEMLSAATSTRRATGTETPFRACKPAHAGCGAQGVEVRCRLLQCIALECVGSSGIKSCGGNHREDWGTCRSRSMGPLPNPTASYDGPRAIVPLSVALTQGPDAPLQHEVHNVKLPSCLPVCRPIR